MSVSRFPLQWPEGWKRAKYRIDGTFKVPFEKAVRELDQEIERLGGRYALLSTNLELRLDGGFRRNVPEPDDPGVAAYFERKGKQQVFACDTFNTVRDNIRAIGLTIASMRAIDRYGSSGMLERALTAFEALPAPKSCWDILGVKPNASLAEIEAAFRSKALKLHPDQGGDNDLMIELNLARVEALKK